MNTAQPFPNGPHGSTPLAQHSMNRSRRPDIGRVAVFGAGGLGREIVQLLLDLAATGLAAEPLAFLVDPDSTAPTALHGLPVHRGAEGFLRADGGVSVVVALGDPMARARVVARLEGALGPRFVTLVHPSAWLGSTVTLGAGSLVTAGVMASADVRIGRHVLLNPGCILAHDAVLGDFATLEPAVALAGGVVVGNGASLGIGARVLPRLSIGAGAVVGGGAVVTQDVAPGQQVAGVPARPLGQSLGQPLGQPQRDFLGKPAPFRQAMESTEDPPMPTQFSNPATVHSTGGRYSHAALVQGERRLVISGQVGTRPDGSIVEDGPGQIAQALANLGAILAAHDMGPANIVKMGVFLTERELIPIWRVKREALLGTLAPASTLLLVAGLADPRFVFEIEAEAVA